MRRSEIHLALRTSGKMCSRTTMLSEKLERVATAKFTWLKVKKPLKLLLLSTWITLLAKSTNWSKSSESSKS